MMEGLDWIREHDRYRRHLIPTSLLNGMLADRHALQQLPSPKDPDSTDDAKWLPLAYRCTLMMI